MQNNDYKILQQETLHQGFVNIIRYKLQHKLFAGGESEPFYRELAKRYDAVTVLPYDPKLNKVVLIEQFRAGAIRKDNPHPWLIELVAGVIDKDKTEQEIACMEVQEEAGLEVLDLIPIYSYFNSPGGSTEKVTLFCAIVDASKADGIHGLKDEHEDIKVHVMSCEEAFAKVKSGKICNASSIIALQWLELKLKLDNLVT